MKRVVYLDLFHAGRFDIQGEIDSGPKEKLARGRHFISRYRDIFDILQKIWGAGEKKNKE